MSNRRFCIILLTSKESSNFIGFEKEKKRNKKKTFFQVWRGKKSSCSLLQQQLSQSKTLFYRVFIKKSLLIFLKDKKLTLKLFILKAQVVLCVYFKNRNFGVEWKLNLSKFSRIQSDLNKEKKTLEHSLGLIFSDGICWQRAKTWIACWTQQRSLLLHLQRTFPNASGALKTRRKCQKPSSSSTKSRRRWKTPRRPCSERATNSIKRERPDRN